VRPLVLPPPNSLGHQSAFLGKPLDAKTALAPRDEDSSRFVLGPLTSVCYGTHDHNSDPRGRIDRRRVTSGKRPGAASGG
jgi:hypothetical protein